MNDGTGYPCAGQSSVNATPRRILNAELSDDVENAGAFEPTGSVQNIFGINSKWKTYLNDGTGNPCAGQRSVNASPKRILNEMLCDVVEKAGAFEATGSVF